MGHRNEYQEMREIREKSERWFNDIKENWKEALCGFLFLVFLFTILWAGLWFIAIIEGRA